MTVFSKRTSYNATSRTGVFSSEKRDVPDSVDVAARDVLPRHGGVTEDCHLERRRVEAARVLLLQPRVPRCGYVTHFFYGLTRDVGWAGARLAGWLADRLAD